MARKEKRMSFDRHQDIGLKLEKMRLQLIDLQIEFSNVYGKTSKIARNCKTAHKQLDQLKSVCDDQVCSEYPDREDAIKVYYGRSDEAAEHVRRKT